MEGSRFAPPTTGMDLRIRSHTGVLPNSGLRLSRPVLDRAYLYGDGHRAYSGASGGSNPCP